MHLRTRPDASFRVLLVCVWVYVKCWQSFTEHTRFVCVFWARVKYDIGSAGVCWMENVGNQSEARSSAFALSCLVAPVRCMCEWARECPWLGGFLRFANFAGANECVCVLGGKIYVHIDGVVARWIYVCLCNGVLLVRVWCRASFSSSSLQSPVPN